MGRLRKLITWTKSLSYNLNIGAEEMDQYLSEFAVLSKEREFGSQHPYLGDHNHL